MLKIAFISSKGSEAWRELWGIKRVSLQQEQSFEHYEVQVRGISLYSRDDLFFWTINML